MGSARSAVAMDDREVHETLQQGLKLQVATIDPDGSPHLTTLFYGLDGDAVVFWTYGKSRKVANLRRDPRISVLVEDGIEYDELRGVSIRGTAEIIDDVDQVRRLGVALYERSSSRPIDDRGRQVIDAQAPKRVVIRVRPDHVVSWDHRKLRN